MLKVEAGVRAIQKETDAEIRKFEKSCSKGCSFCCHQTIKIIAVEELPIIEYLDKGVNSKVKKAIKDNLIKWFDYFEKNTPDNLPLKENDILEFESKAAKDRVPCPFLINNFCSIYPARPIVCRTHIVQDNPNECEKNPLRGNFQSADEIRFKKLNDLYYLDQSPYNHVRLLPYPFNSYFSIGRKLKPIKNIVVK